MQHSKSREKELLPEKENTENRDFWEFVTCYAECTAF